MGSKDTEIGCKGVGLLWVVRGSKDTVERDKRVGWLWIEKGYSRGRKGRRDGGGRKGRDGCSG